MKKLLIVVMLAISCIACHSQECPYRFLGIPIEGTMDEFAKKLEQKGFKKNYYTEAQKYRDNGMYNYCFTGKFFGEDCKIILASLDPNSNIIAMVVVAFDKNNIALYRSLSLALAKQYYDTNKWCFDGHSDIGGLSDYQIRQSISEGGVFMLRVMDIKADRPYINLAIKDNSLCVTYLNSSRLSKIEGEKEAKKAQDL